MTPVLFSCACVLAYSATVVPDLSEGRSRHRDMLIARYKQAAPGDVHRGLADGTFSPGGSVNDFAQRFEPTSRIEHDGFTTLIYGGSGPWGVAWGSTTVVAKGRRLVYAHASDCTIDCEFFNALPRLEWVRYWQSWQRFQGRLGMAQAEYYRLLRAAPALGGPAAVTALPYTFTYTASPR